MNTRRELVRQYKESGPAAGVYVVRNTADGRNYVGASMNAEGALNRARFELRRGAFRNASLAADWRRLGEDAFEFEVVDVLKKKDDPAFDAQAELEAMRDLWREELHATSAQWLS